MAALYNRHMKTHIPIKRGRKPIQTAEREYPNQVRRLRLERGWPLKYIAYQLGVSYQAIHEVETRGTGISRRNWYKLADLFDIDPRLLESPDKHLPPAA